MVNEDRLIIQRVLAGEKAAYGELVDRHQQKAMALALRMLRNKEDAEEALQDAFVRAFHALPRFEWKSSFSTWFYRIVYNVCASAGAQRSSEPVRSLDEENEEGLDREYPDGNLPPDLACEQAELDAILKEEIDRLPEAYGATFSLFFMQELSYEEIVEVTSLPLGTVKARIFRARMLLRNAVIRRLGREHVAAFVGKEKSV